MERSIQLFGTSLTQSLRKAHIHKDTAAKTVHCFRGPYDGACPASAWHCSVLTNHTTTSACAPFHSFPPALQFLAAPGSRHAVLEHQDDLLWFVTAAPALTAGMAPVTLRRNVSSTLPPELRPGGRDFGTVDWAASVQLNLVVQATYVLTVVQCE